MKITHDVLDVAARLKEIDPEYELHFDAETGRFSLRDSRGGIQLTYPYPTVDVRMVYDAERTRIERMQSILKEIESANERAENSYLRAEDNNIKDGLRDAAERYYSGLRRGSR